MSRGQELHEDREVVKEAGRKPDVLVPQKPREEHIVGRTGGLYCQGSQRSNQ